MDNIAVLESEIRQAELESLEKYRQGSIDAPILFRACGYSKEDTAKKRAGPMVFVASEESPDRIGDVISVNGWELDAFRRNPVLMFGHDRSIPPIGNVPKVWAEGKQLLNTVAWDEEDSFARLIKGKYERRFMRAESVGFRALEFEENTSGKGITFTRQELLEISLVAVPMHPEALQKMLGSRRFSIVVPESIPVAEIPVNMPEILIVSPNVDPVTPDPTKAADNAPDVQQSWLKISQLLTSVDRHLASLREIEEGHSALLEQLVHPQKGVVTEPIVKQPGPPASSSGEITDMELQVVLAALQGVKEA